MRSSSLVSLRARTRASYRCTRLRSGGILNSPIYESSNSSGNSIIAQQLLQSPHCHRSFSETSFEAAGAPNSSDGTDTSTGNTSQKQRNRNQPIQNSWSLIKNRILDIPVGELSSAQWHEAQEALKTTTEEADSIASSWSVLDRLQEEALAIHIDGTTNTQTKAKRQQGATAQDGALLSTDALSWVVNSWRVCAAKKEKPPLTSQDIMVRLDRYSESGLVRPNVQTYTMVIDAIRYTEDPSRAPLTAESLLKDMLLQREKNKDISISPNRVTICSILHLWSRSGLSEAPQKVEQHLATLKDWYQQELKSNSAEISEPFRPDERVYVTVISTWAKSGNRHAGRRATELLQEMKETPGLEPSNVVYSAVLDAMAKSGQADEAHALLNEMLRLYFANKGAGNTTTTAVQPDVYAFASVMGAYARAGKAEVAEGLLQEMETMCEQTRNENFRPNTGCYNILIGAFAGIREPHRAQAVFERMMESPYDSVKPNLASFNQVLHAWAKSGNVDAVERVTAILDRIELLHSKHSTRGESPLKPNHMSYNNLLNCYANSPNPRKYAPFAQQKLEWMHLQSDASMKPTRISYNIVLRAWGKAGLPQKADGLLRDICRLYRNSQGSLIAPHVDLFITVIAGWAVSKDKEAPQRVEALLKLMEDLHDTEGLETKPNQIAYNAFLDCLARSRDPNAAHRAERVLRRMQDQWRAGFEGIKPDVVSFTSVITAWSRSKHAEAPVRAEVLFREMQESKDGDLQPDPVTYCALMSAFSRHNRPFKVQTVFDAMEARYKAGDSSLRPNVPAYTTLIQAWAKAAGPERAAVLLADMIHKFETGELDLKPDTRIFNTVLQAWCRSGRPDAADKAEEGLDSMHSLAASGRFNVRPDLFTYSFVISAHVTLGRSDSAERVHKLLQRLKKLYAETNDVACRPDLRVYADVVCAWIKSDSPQAANIIEELILELSLVGGRSWKEQGLIPCRRMVDALSSSLLPESVQLTEHLLVVMRSHGLHLDASTAKTASFFDERHSTK
jgi:pentatricopeptide repeat protein